MVVPIIENTARECELTDRLREAIGKYPEANAVLVRRHGVYVWGDNWIHAKTQFECYEYLFEAAVRMHALGINPKAAPAPPPLVSSQNGILTRTTNNKSNDTVSNHPPTGSSSVPSCIVLDIEGTVAPISFVAEVLFPYAKDRLRSHLEATFESAETADVVQMLREQAEADGTPLFTAAAAAAAAESKSDMVDSIVVYCEAQMAADRKMTALKTLQGHIWRHGFANGELKAELFRDVPDALVTWRGEYGIKTFIYSSGSRQAQRDLFSHTTCGDLRPYICGFFDTTSGSKIESAAYHAIELSLGVDSPSDILFATDNILEARAAAVAGWRAVIVDRPGNNPLPVDCEFTVVTSMGDLF